MITAVHLAEDHITNECSIFKCWTTVKQKNEKLFGRFFILHNKHVFINSVSRRAEIILRVNHEKVSFDYADHVITAVFVKSFVTGSTKRKLLREHEKIAINFLFPPKVLSFPTWIWWGSCSSRVTRYFAAAWTIW